VQKDVQAANAAHGILTQAGPQIGGITFYRDGQHSSTLQAVRQPGAHYFVYAE